MDNEGANLCGIATIRDCFNNINLNLYDRPKNSLYDV